MRASELLRTTAFRWAFTCAGSFACGVLLFAGLIYHETVGYLLRRVDAQLHADARSISQGPRSEQIDDVREYLSDDPEQFKVAGLFDRAGRPLAGNLRVLPALLPHGTVSELRLPRNQLSSDRRAGAGAYPTAARPLPQRPRRVRLLLDPLPGGTTLVVGVGGGAVHEIENIVSRALWVTLPPMLLLALVTGYVVSRGALRRIGQVHESSRRIMAGQLHERLPTRGTQDAFDELSKIVNAMLDEIERLLLETKGVGEGIAHDLRTPLTRLRARLERALEMAGPRGDGSTTLAAGIEDIDQILGTINALLRIAEVEHGARRAEFRSLDLRPIVRDAVELYEPIAEDKHSRVQMDLPDVSAVVGDGDLLFEAVANLIDNAIKFSPAGGRIEVQLRQSRHGPLVAVSDAGPGIAPADWERVTRRFFRKDPSRHMPGNGLGLSLVAAITRLHGFALTLDASRRGCCIALECWTHTAEGSEERRPGGAECGAGGLVPLPVPLRARAATGPAERAHASS